MATMVTFVNFPVRRISTSCVVLGKKNFRKFLLYGKRGSRQFKEMMRTNPDPEFLKLHSRGARPTGFGIGKDFKDIPEMIPELIVPDLTGFKLKPYVSYRVADSNHEPFLPQDLFYAIYSKKIADDFKQEKLDEDGNSLEPSLEETLTPEQAADLAKRTGSDIFNPEPPLRK